MKELLGILQQARSLKAKEKKYALATVVKIGGSTYRRPGARMLISEEGERWGTISGGCLEGEVAKRAVEAIEAGQPVLVPFDLEEDDIILGFGTGCNGIVHVLIQPQDANDPEALIEALDFCMNHREASVIASVINVPAEAPALLGQHLLLLEGDEQGPSKMDATLREALTDQGRGFLQEEKADGQMYLWHTRQVETSQGEVEVLFEIVRPPVSLYIFGEGHDVHAMLAQGLLLGWDVTIIGRKPVPVLSERFPKARDWKFLMHPEQVLDLVTPDARSAALVMNHTYIRDREIMQRLLISSIPYVGMLGPKERTRQMMEDLSEKDEALSEESLERLFAPLGLDIGTETPEEIALSAVSEIQAILHRRVGASLRKRQSPIHASRVPIEAL